MNIKIILVFLMIFSVLSVGCISTTSENEKTEKIKVGRSSFFEDERYMNQTEVWNHTFDITEDMQPWNVDISLKWSDEGWRGLCYDFQDIFEVVLILHCINGTVKFNEIDSDGEIDLIWGNSSFKGIESIEVQITCLEAGDIYNLLENGTCGNELIHVDEGNSYSLYIKMRYYLYIDEDEATMADLIRRPL